MQRVVVAFSGGVDSALLLKVAADELGPANVIAATGVSASLAQSELADVRQLAGQMGVRLEEIPTRELDDPQYAANNDRRCFFCKTELYRQLTDLARRLDFTFIVNGANADDTGDYRPGMEAARQWAVRSPLLEAGLSKADVRELAQALGLAVWDKPALACLSSRVAYGTPVTMDSLRQIEAAEAFLRGRGFRVLRVRHHGKLARIEVPGEDLPRLTVEPLRGEIVAHFKSLGYTYVSLDLQGFRSGSGNEIRGRRLDS